MRMMEGIIFGANEDANVTHLHHHDTAIVTPFRYIAGDSLWRLAQVQ